MSDEEARGDPLTADAAGLAEWLWSGIRKYHATFAGEELFHPYAKYRFSGREDLTTNLRNLYRVLSKRDQERWREALELLLRERREEMGRFDLPAKEVVRLATMAGARGMLEELPGILNANEKAAFEVISHAMSFLGKDPDPAVARCFERFRLSHNFNLNYAGLVLKGLLYSNPDRWLDHVLDLADDMNAIKEKLDEGSDAMRNYAWHVRCAARDERLDMESLREVATAPQLRWLWLEWFEEPDGLLLGGMKRILKGGE